LCKTITPSTNFIDINLQYFSYFVVWNFFFRKQYYFDRSSNRKDVFRLLMFFSSCCFSSGDKIIFIEAGIV